MTDTFDYPLISGDLFPPAGFEFSIKAIMPFYLCGTFLKMVVSSFPGSHPVSHPALLLQALGAFLHLQNPRHLDA